MERPMKKVKLPDTDSVQKLAEFWDTHDATDFQDQLEDVTTPVFDRKPSDESIRIPLKLREAKAVQRLAKVQGVTREELVRTWVLQKIAGS